MVTSGAIALGMRLMELPRRPSSIDEMQAASAVGQGTLFRAYESRLAARDVHAAQVLLTSFDLAVRMHYLNARQALRKLLDWRAVPVVNENDTTATDEITFGDNDFLSAQVALLLGARLLVLLTDTPGLHTADPRHASRRRAGRAGRGLRGARALRDRRADLARSAPAACAARSRPRGWRAPRGSRRRSATAPHRRRCSPRPAARWPGPSSSRTRSALLPSSSGCATRSRRADGCSSTRARHGCCASADRACCRWGSPASRASSPPATRSRSSATATSSARGSATTRRPS